MGDYIVRATAADLQIRAFAIDSTILAEKARNIHKCTPVVTAALGRLLSCAGMMASMMKGENDKLMIQISSDGPMKGLTVSADGKGNVKGYAINPFVDIPLKRPGKLDVGGAIGRGTLSVSMDLGLREPYSGQIELVSGEIGDDMAYYFTKSEQTPSAVGLGVMVDKDQSVKHAGGFIIQLMPFATEEVISLLEDKLAGIDSVTSLMEKGMNPEEILQYILGNLSLEFTEKSNIEFKCDCSKEKYSRALATLNKNDLLDLIKDNEEIETKCYFCNSAYKFSVDELKQILSERGEE